MTSITIQIPDDLLERLQSLAELNQMSIDTLVIDVLKDFIEDDDEEPSIEEIRKLVEDSLNELAQGKLLGADEALTEIRRDLIA